MSMMQLVIGAALGFITAQGLLFGARQFVGWANTPQLRAWLVDLIPTQRFAAFGGFGKYATLVLGSAALITVGLWGVVNYLATKSEHKEALAAALDPANAPLVHSAEDSAQTVTASPAAARNDSEASAGDAIDPYADPDFKVHRRPHRAGSSQSLKETLVQREEFKARSELLRETAQHAQRSQYDCEVADHVGHYLKADLDVWGFSSWQTKYFPMDGYKGATLPQCKDIQDVLDPAHLNLQTTVAQQK